MFQVTGDLLKPQAKKRSKLPLRRSKSVARRKFPVMCCIKAATLQRRAIFFLCKQH
jgi:hypothetical protein